MKKIIILAVSVIWLGCNSYKATSQSKKEKGSTFKKYTYPGATNAPKLVVGIVVDQMRYDYLTRFYTKYGEGGFKRLMNEGYNLQNVHYNYIPTYTAVGHTSIYSGTTPTNHGIIANTWYDKYLKKEVYCVDDSNYKTVGAPSGGSKSPYRMLTTTITDELRMAQNMKGKTISLSIKDRSAILPGGHTANGAYWFEGGEEGKFISSTFYMNELPKWVKEFNSLNKADDYLNEVWNTYYNINTYTETLPDHNKYEGLFDGKDTPTFPYDLKELRKKNKNFSLIKKIPAGNSIVNDFAKAAIVGEQLGIGNQTDFLAISYSSTDYVGHQFGVDSKELEDTYIRLDKDLESLLQFLDDKVGKGNYTLFLTADHAAVQVPAYLNDIKIPGGYFDIENFKKFIAEKSIAYFGTSDLVENISNFQIFFNKQKIKELGLNPEKVADKLMYDIIDFDKIYKAVSAKTLQTTTFSKGILSSLQNGYNQKFSGDILLIPNPSTIIYPHTGTTHGSGYSYDTHVPLLFYGKGIKKGNSHQYYPIVNLAPTISSLLHISQPNGCTGEAIIEVLKK